MSLRIESTSSGILPLIQPTDLIAISSDPTAN